MSDNIIDTNGWHTVAAITYTDVNKAIAATGSGPKDFSVTAPDGSASMDATFGPWRLVTGGSGPLLMMALPITAGKVTIGSDAHDVTPCEALIKVTATYIPGKGSLRDLVPADDQPCAVEAATPPQQNFLVDAALKDLLQHWLDDNLNEFNAVFASVDLDADYTLEGVEWLKPSFKGYAVAEPSQGATLDNSVFGVLCLIDGTPEPAGLVWQISPYAIPAKAHAGFVISEEKFLEHMMLAAVPAMFKDIQDQPPTDHFVIDNLNTRIRNTNDVTLLPVKLANGHVVSPTVSASNFSIQLESAEMELEITDMQFEYSPGITVHLNYSGKSTFSLDAEHDILQVSVVNESGSGSVEVSKGIEITEIVMGVASIVLAVVGGFGGAVSRTASAAVDSATEASLGAAEAAAEDAEVAAETTIKCCLGLVNGTPAEVGALAARCMAVAKVGAIGAFCTTLMPAITTIIKAVAEGDYESMPKITALTDSAVGETVIWPDAVGEFVLGSAQLAGAFQFGLVHKA